MWKVILSLVLAMSFISRTTAQENRSIPVLIVDGFSNHDWEQTTAVTKWILENSDYFEVDVSTVPADSMEWTTWSPEFDQYAVVIQNTNNIDAPHLKWPAHEVKKMEAYVESGGGQYILHSANNAFPHWDEYYNIIRIRCMSYTSTNA